VAVVPTLSNWCFCRESQQTVSTVSERKKFEKTDSTRSTWCGWLHIIDLFVAVDRSMLLVQGI
jgi:hypothetical protein